MKQYMYNNFIKNTLRKLLYVDRKVRRLHLDLHISRFTSH